MENVDKRRITKQIRIDIEWHRYLKDLSRRTSRTISSLMDDVLSEFSKKREVEMSKLNKLFSGEKGLAEPNLKAADQIKLLRKMLYG